jgi:RNA polymerase sigma-70 factor, ECF subfamily
MIPINPETGPLRTNAAWVELLSLGNQSVIQELREFVLRGVFFGLRGKINKDCAEDFAQEAMIKILKALPTFRGDCLFTTWALSIAMRVAFSELRRARWKDISWSSFREEPSATEPASHAESPDAVFHRTELFRLLRRSIDAVLSDRQRTLIQAELDGIPQSVLCDHLGINRNALYKLGHDARLKLKAALINAGISEVDVRLILDTKSNH